MICRRLPACTLPSLLLSLALLTLRSLSAQAVESGSNPVASPTQVPSTTAIATPATPVATPSTALSPAPTPAMAQPSAGMQKSAESSAQGVERASYSSVHVDQPVIALTFDDGPIASKQAKGKSISMTPRLLDMLKQRNIKVTFFVLGQMVKANPELLKREAAEGHEIGNHTWDHLALPKVISKEGGLAHEIGDTSAIIKEVTGKAPTLLRPPYGAGGNNPHLCHAIENEYGMKVVLWSVDPDDWKDPGPQVVANRILNGWKESGGVKPGAIILVHDIHAGTIDAMPSLLDALLAKGYKFVTVSELLAMEKAPSAAPAAKSTSKPTPKP